jgi:hypothetical protein
VEKDFRFLLSVIPSRNLEPELFKAVTICVEGFIFDDSEKTFEDFWVGLRFLSFVKKLPISKLQ